MALKRHFRIFSSGLNHMKRIFSLGLLTQIKYYFNGRKSCVNKYLSILETLSRKKNTGFTISQSLSISEIEELYNKVVLKQSFYNEDYSAQWTKKPYAAMAEILVNVLNPKKHVDIGCGIGLLVLSMRERNIQSFGVDFSEELINQADTAIRKYVQVCTGEEFIEGYEFRDTDLITYMEVFEHLPISSIEKTLQAIKKHYTGKLFLSIPSFGIDPLFKTGTKVTQGGQCWLANMEENRPFENIILENGFPHNGHITLASYRWWTDFFLYNGFSRNRDIESKMHSKYDQILRQTGWNPYVLEGLPEIHSINTSLYSGNGLGKGWHSLEENRFRWTDGAAILYFRAGHMDISHIVLKFSAPSINVIEDYWLIMSLERLCVDSAFRFRWQPLYSSFATPIKEREKLHTVKLPLSPNHLNMNPHEHLADCWRIILLTNSSSPEDYGISPDNRKLGLCIHSIEVITVNADQN